MTTPTPTAATPAMRPTLADRLVAAGLAPAPVAGTVASLRARCPSCRQAGAQRVTSSLRVTTTPAGPLVTCLRGCPAPTVLRALDALDGWGVTP